MFFFFHDESLLDNKAVTLGSGTTNVFGGTPSAFGNTQQQQTQPPSQSLAAFGNTQPANNTSAFGTFGIVIFETLFSFFLIFGSVGTSTIKPSVFGTQSNTTQPNNTTFGTFGNPQPQQNPNQQPSLFGNNTLFGNQQQQPQNQQQGAQPNPSMYYFISGHI